MIKLNPEQLSAVTRTDGPLLVLAGAGTGKTQVIASRICHLVTTLQVPPDQILVVTFTAAAALNLQQRVKDCLQDKTAGFVAHTYQSLGTAILQQDIAPDDINKLATTTLEKFPEVLANWQKKFRYIMVDDFQDTTTGEFKLVVLLAKAHRNLCVTGDDDQIIYRFRGADNAQKIIDFLQKQPDCRTIKLEQNYRSTSTIVGAANALISNNNERSDKALWTASGTGELINLLVADTDDEESRQVVEQLQLAQYRNKRPWRDFAILYRSNAQSRAFEEALRIEDVPYILVGGQKFFERKEVKDSLSYLAVLANPDNEEALARIINFPHRGIGLSAILQIKQWARTQNVSLYSALGRVVEIEGLNKTDRKHLYRFYQTISEEIANFTNKNMAAQVTAMFIRLELYQELYRTIDNPIQVNKLINEIELRIDDLSTFEQQNSAASLADFLLYLNKLQETQNDQRQNAVTLMSLHASKGLEFPQVFLVGLEEGLLPHHRSIDEDPEVAEERRLCYVGITRASEHLTISRCLKRRKYGTWEERTPSRFLAEIPTELIEGGETTSDQPIEVDMGLDFFARMQNM